MLFGRKLIGLGVAGVLVMLGTVPSAHADTSDDGLLAPERTGILDRLDELDRLGLLRPGEGSESDPADPDAGSGPSGPGADGDGPGTTAGLVPDPTEPTSPSDPSAPSDQHEKSGQPSPEASQSTQGAAASGTHPRAGRSRSGPVVRTVTLVTGDRVRLEYGAAPGPRVRVTPGKGRHDITFDVTRDDGSVTVVPSDARPLLEAGRVDPRLFDVTGLVRQNYHDGATDQLPLMVEAEPATLLGPLRTPADTGAGIRSWLGPLRLPSVGMVATEFSKRELEEFWGPLESVAVDAVKQVPGSVLDRVPAPVVESGASGGAVAAGDAERTHPERTGADFDVDSMDAPRTWRALAIQPSRIRKVWLDGQVRAMGRPAGAAVRAEAPTASPDENLRRIGAPAAWRHGLTGKGVRIAVLDSGVDARHPDLAGRIARTRDFVGGGAADEMGHGTHVASVLAGSGELSDGTYRGVAPDARLFVGRVLDERGAGAESEVIAGMEWAVRRGVDVVNVSLGNDKPSDGKDPMSRAANRLGDRALFVAAAGNGGPDYRTISTPGAAERALTVAAVHDDGETADFSSRGPRRGDSLAKPDIAAPGVNVVGARARGTEAGPVVAHRYVELTGTSMAVPYVSGAAAMLAQARPDWSARQLKQGLMAAARSRHDGREQGAGELDLERLVRQLGTAEQTGG